MSRNPATAIRSASAGSSGRGVDMDMAIVGKQPGRRVPCRRLPVFDMIEQRLSTRSGWSIVSCWAIIPPIDTPTTCAAGDAEVVEQGHGIGGHVGEQVVRLRVAPVGERLEQRGPRRHRTRGLRRQPDVAVVHPDDPEPTVGEPVDEVAAATRRAAHPGP